MYASPENFGQSSLNGVERKLREDSKFRVGVQLTCLRVTMDYVCPSIPAPFPSSSPHRNLLLLLLLRRGVLFPSLVLQPGCLQFSFRIIRSFVWIRLPRNLNKFHLPSVPISTQTRSNRAANRPPFNRLKISSFHCSLWMLSNTLQYSKSWINWRKKEEKKEIRRESDPLADPRWPFIFTKYERFHG